MRARGGVGTHWQPLNTLKTPRKCKPGVGSGQVGARCQPLGKQPHGTELAPPRQAGSADNGNGSCAIQTLKPISSKPRID